jgi:hypothetical protein
MVKCRLLISRASGTNRSSAKFASRAKHGANLNTAAQPLQQEGTIARRNWMLRNSA